MQKLEQWGYSMFALNGPRDFYSHLSSVVPTDMHTTLGGVPIFPPFAEYEGRKLPEVLNASRASLETLLRTLVRKSEACKNVEFVTGTVTAVIPASDAPKRLSGVQVRMEGHSEPTVISAELVAGKSLSS